GGQMQWTSLKLKGASSNELYLACGALGKSEEPEECQPYNGQSYQEKCPYSEDYLTYTWDKNNCEYIKSGVCKTRYLTGYQCQWAVDICEGGESFTRHYGSTLNLADCGNGGTSITDDHFFAHGEYPSSVAGWVEYNFKFLASGPYNDSSWYLDCEVGRPCPSCEVGKKYIYRSLESHPGVIQACFSYGGCASYSGSYAVSALVSYAECRETTEDWTDLTDRDGSLLSEQLCDPYTWRRN
ncbi:MAG: hypothetical protein Q4P84_04535, partial [Elusimicrobiales bacterium]|nr:hypothetical protein [Elusimicrobiales bacterium]